MPVEIPAFFMRSWTVLSARNMERIVRSEKRTRLGPKTGGTAGAAVSSPKYPICGSERTVFQPEKGSLAFQSAGIAHQTSVLAHNPMAGDQKGDRVPPDGTSDGSGSASFPRSLTKKFREFFVGDRFSVRDFP